MCHLELPAPPHQVCFQRVPTNASDSDLFSLPSPCQLGKMKEFIGCTFEADFAT
jgi:hypothetical protein